MKKDTRIKSLRNKIEDLSKKLKGLILFHPAPVVVDRMCYVIISLVTLLSILAMVNGITTKSLLLDEALFARNVREFPRGYYQQSAPSAPLFYLLSYIIVSIFGNAEWVYRLLPSLSAVAGLGFMIVLLWKQFSKIGAVVATILLATSIPFIEYGANGHPYATDLFCTVLLLYMTHLYLMEPSRIHWLVLMGACIFSIGMSFPAIFMVISIGAVMIIGDLWRHDYTALWQKMKGLIPIAVLISCLGLFIYLPKAGSRDDMTYWAGYFPDNLTPWSFFNWTYMSTSKLLGYLLWNSQGGVIGLFLLLLGTAWFIMKKRYILCAVCWIPLFLSVGAALFQKWPYGPIRVMLFLLPLFVILIGGGIEWIWQFGKSKLIKIFIFLACLVLLIPQSWILTRGFVRIEDSDEAVRSLSIVMKRDIIKGDIFIIYYAAEVHFEYYFKGYWGYGILQPWSNSGNHSAMEDFLESKLKNLEGRFWLFFSHVIENEDEVMIAMAEKWGLLLQSYKYPGCSAYLFRTLDGASTHHEVKIGSH